MSRLNNSSCAQRTAEEGRYFTVPRPNEHEGVSRALRRAYRQPENGLPIEMIELLGKLNQIPV